MKDAKGHGSNPRGTAAGYAGRDKLGRTYTQAIRDHDRFPAQNPNMPDAEAYRTPGWDYGKTLGNGPTARPSNPHPDSATGRAMVKRGEGVQLQLGLSTPEQKMADHAGRVLGAINNMGGQHPKSALVGTHPAMGSPFNHTSMNLRSGEITPKRQPTKPYGR